MKSTRDFADDPSPEKKYLRKVYMRTRRMKLRTRRIKGGHLWWNNPFKSAKNNAKDCKRWNKENKEGCSYEQIQKFYYPGRTNRGRIPTLLQTPQTEMTPADWCQAVPHIDQPKLNYLNTLLKEEFHPTKSCKRTNLPESEYVELVKRGVKRKEGKGLKPWSDVRHGATTIKRRRSSSSDSSEEPEDYDLATFYDAQANKKSLSR